MDMNDFAYLRLRNQRLSDHTFSDLKDAVGAMVAIQAQEYPEAKWGIAMRTPGVASRDIDAALADGTLIRTHVLRPTWHLTLASDIRWMLDLTAARIRSSLASRWRQLGLDEATFQRSQQILDSALTGQHLTRPELAKVLESRGISTDGQRMPHLLLRAELDQVICSGGVRGKEHTFARFDDRVPQARPRDREEALADLARRYISSRGPATVHDFAWWSGLTVTDARAGIHSVESELTHEIMDGQTYWFAPDVGTSGRVGPRVHLLPHYDEFLVSYKDHHPSFHEEAWRQRPRSDDHLRKGFLLDGRVAGVWRRKMTPREIQITAEPAVTFGLAERGAFEAIARRFGDCHERQTTVNWA